MKSRKRPKPAPTDILLPYQRAWVYDQSRFKIGLWARQTGKSLACAAEAVESAVGRHGTEWVVISAGERQALEFMLKARDFADAWKMVARNYVEVRDSAQALLRSAEITWQNGSRLIALPANPDTARGYSGNLILDEFAFHDRPAEIWRAIYPSISSPFRGEKKLRIVSTPNGKTNKFHDLWHCPDNPARTAYSHHKISIYDAVAQGLKIDVEELKAGLADPDGWAQEYECQFIDNSSVLVPYDLIMGCESAEATEAMVPRNITNPFATQPQRFVGIDIGRKQHLTVCWTLEKLGDVFWTREVLVLEKMTFHQQFELLLPRVRAATTSAVDSTGIGAMLGEELKRLSGRGVVLPCQFTASFKEVLFLALRRRFEERTLRIPSSTAIREDIHALQKIVSLNGTVRYLAAQAEDGHSDRATALALAIHAGEQPPRSYVSIRVIRPYSALQHSRRNGKIDL